ncbi:unnamed protein product, partial [Symbiodinium sp. CCMP2456]
MCLCVHLFTKMNFAGDVPAAEEAMQHARGSMAALINLDVLPSLSLAEAAKDLDSQEVANALAGKKHVWWHHDSDDHCTPLPQWVNTSLEFAIMEYVKEHQKWQAQIAARGGKGLTAAASAKYEAWKGNPYRILLLDPARKAALGKGERATANSKFAFGVDTNSSTPTDPETTNVCYHHAK